MTNECKHKLDLVDMRLAPDGFLDILSECKICKERILFGGCYATAYHSGLESAEGVEVTELELDYD